MIIDTTKRTAVVLSPKQLRKPLRGQSESVSAGDVVEVEVIRNGKTISKGR